MAIIITRREFRTPIDGAAACLTGGPVQRLMKTLHVAVLAMLALLGAPPVSEGQQTNNIPRLCFLTLDIAEEVPTIRRVLPGFARFGL